MNLVVISGNLSKDVELRYTKNNTPVATFHIAVNRENEGVDFFPVVVWNKQAENCDKYLEKGSKVLIKGRMETRSYEVNDEKRNITEVIAERVEFIGNKKEQAPTTEAPQKEAANPFEEFGQQFEVGHQIEIDEESDLPF